MGAKQTKIVDISLTQEMQNAVEPSTPTQTDQLLLVQTDFMNDELDPRSPNGCRTPINLLSKRTYVQPEKPAEIVYQEQLQSTEQSSENALAVLRKRFFRGFYNLNDPRSPELNRTPLVFDDVLDKTLNLDDTFADLFVDSRAPTDLEIVVQNPVNIEPIQLDVDDFDMGTSGKEAINDNNKAITIEQQQLPEHAHFNNSSLEIVSLCDEEETMPCPAVLSQTPIAFQIDPRSPSIGVDRTPIIFSDDDEDSENAMLENILATLSLNLSNDSSIASFGTPSNVISLPNENPLLTAKPLPKPANKHLERVRNTKKRAPSRPKVAALRAQRQRSRIYEDSENILPTTPKQKLGAESPAGKRTPFGCVKNRAICRTPESLHKSLKTNAMSSPRPSADIIKSLFDSSLKQQ